MKMRSVNLIRVCFSSNKAQFRVLSCRKVRHQVSSTITMASLHPEVKVPLQRSLINTIRRHRIQFLRCSNSLLPGNSLCKCKCKCHNNNINKLHHLYSSNSKQLPLHPCHNINNPLRRYSNTLNLHRNHNISLLHLRQFSDTRKLQQHN